MRINKKNVKETRQLNLEISEKEREANLTAPATRNKSERAKKVNYRESKRGETKYFFEAFVKKKKCQKSLEDHFCFWGVF